MYDPRLLLSYTPMSLRLLALTFLVHVLLLPSLQVLLHSPIQLADSALRLDAFFEGFQPSSMNTCFYKTCAHDGRASAASMCTMHKNVTSLLLGLYGKGRRLVELGRCRRHTVPSGHGKIFSRLFNTALGELDGQINDGPPILVQLVGITTADPPAGLDFCRNGANLLDNFPFLFDLVGSCQRMYMRVDECGNVEGEENDITPQGNVAGGAVFPQETHARLELKEDRNETVDHSRIAQDEGRDCPPKGYTPKASGASGRAIGGPKESPRRVTDELDGGEAAAVVILQKVGKAGAGEGRNSHILEIDAVDGSHGGLLEVKYL